MEGEINNFIVVWSTVLACLCYCHFIGNLFPKPNFGRLSGVLPVAGVFFLLPLNLTSSNLGGGTAFLIGWLGSFKLLLFAFGSGPLCSSPPLPLSRFVALACLPIKFQECSERSPEKKSGGKSPVNYLTKLVLLGTLFRVYTYEGVPPKLLMLFYCCHIYFVLDLWLTAVSAAVRAVAGVELEPPFDDPHLATSLQDFWGRRWNLMVTNILRPAVYDPIRAAAARLLPRKWAALPAVVATFLVSGIMHELVFYNIGRVKPTGEVMCFFLIHGVCLAMEIGAKKAINGRFRLPGIVSGPLSLSFVILTSFWLFFPPFLRNKPDVKACTEVLAFIEFVKHKKLVSPSNITCPYL
ncbi:PREDICTED: acyl-CoA--sterol O-acyltransferase 1-like [Ipomoea nil]|uniref:acyl-CoA--sterol O-acyltransferase 1-like n=1 Tax=Ipomoea nil TaxID=35883 RepID=UPI000900D784|nr:PREDICTED: acyl-CoA--sterol O-acyltransferase 1-like [Ipomoea nil]